MYLTVAIETIQNSTSVAFIPPEVTFSDQGPSTKNAVLVVRTAPSTPTEWVNRADLYRVKGVGGQYSDLLEQSGVDTVMELAQRNPKNLHETLIETNERCHLVRKVPTELQVKAWVKHAKTLKRVVEY